MISVRRYLLTLALVVVMSFTIAAPVLAYLYYASVTIVESNGTSYSGLPVIFYANNDWMASNGYMNSTGNDTRVETVGGTEYPHLVADNKTLVALDVGGNSQTNLLYTMGNSELPQFYMMTGVGGYFTVSDDATIELGGDGSIAWATAYLNTATSANLTYKQDAINIVTGSGNVTASIWGSANLNPTGTNDPSGTWTNDGNIIDGNTGTFAFSGAIVDSYTDYIEATLTNPQSISAIRFWCLQDATRSIAEIDTYDGSTWTNIYNGTPTNGNWTTVSLSAILPDVEKIRFRQYITGGPSSSSLYEIEYYNGATVSQTVAAGEHDYLQVAMASPFLSQAVDTNQPASGYVTDGLDFYYLPQWKGYDGVDDVDDLGSDFAAMTGDFTIEAWINPSTVTGDQEFISTRQGKNDNTCPYAVYITGSDATFRMGTGTGAKYVIISNAASIGTWLHLVATVSGTTMNLYADGVVGTPTTFTGTRQTGTKVTVGAADTTYGRIYSGLIGTIRIYDGTALSSTEVSQNYALGQPPAQITPVAQNLVMNAPLGQVEEYAAPGGTFTTIDGNEFTATVTGATWTSQGYDFAAAGDIVIGDDASLDITDGLTIDGWVKADTLGVFQGMVGKATTTWSQASYAVQFTDTNQINFVLSSDGTAVGLTTLTATASTLPINTWINITATFDKPTMNIYINGVFSNDATWNNDIFAGTSDVYIGKYTGNSPVFNGLIGEVKIYDSALTSDQVLQNYNATKLKYLGAGDISTYSTLATVADNGNDYTFNESESVSYAADTSITAGGVLVTEFAPNDIIAGTVLPDRVGANDGDITWGANPAGVSANLSSLVSTGQSSVGQVTATPAPDVIPDVTVSDWFTPPSVAGTLLTNPLRPFVTIMSDATAMTEQQSWWLLGLAALLFVTVLAMVAVRGHYIITGIVAGAFIGLLVQQTIWPMWTLVFIIPAIGAGAVAERTPSL